MKNLPILRWALIGLVHLPMSILGFIICPLIYNYRVVIRNKRNALRYKVLWWFLNDSVPKHVGDRDWGDYGRYSHNFLGYLKQSANRNSHWNFRRSVLQPKKGIPVLIKSYYSNIYNKNTKRKIYNHLLLCNINNVWGYQCSKYSIAGYIYFKFSFTFVIGNRLLHIQLGEGNNRYLYKLKFTTFT